MAVLSGQKAVPTAGTAVRLSSTVVVNGPVMVKALLTNSAAVYVGNVNGSVDSTNGLPLAAGEAVVFDQVGNLMELWVNSAVNGEGVAWLGLRL